MLCWEKSSTFCVQGIDIAPSSLTHVDKKYYIQTNVRDLFSIKISIQIVMKVFQLSKEE